jgi:uncharacterized protein YceK
MKYLAITVSVFLALALSGCATMVTIETNVPGASVRMNNQVIGTTPVSKEMTNAIWETQNVVIQKDGYKVIRAPLQKEIKAVPAVAGFFLLWPLWLWAYGPMPEQVFDLEAQ